MQTNELINTCCFHYLYYYNICVFVQVILYIIYIYIYITHTHIFERIFDYIQSTYYCLWLAMSLYALTTYICCIYPIYADGIIDRSIGSAGWYLNYFCPPPGPGPPEVDMHTSSIHRPASYISYSIDPDHACMFHYCIEST